MVALRVFCFLLFMCAALAVFAEDEEQDAAVKSLLKKAQTAAGSGELDMAVKLLGKAIDAAPDRAALYDLRADYLMRQRKHKLALADYDRLVKQQPDDAGLRFLRGVARFKSGDAAGSIADWDHQIELNPKSEKSHWQRGISYYYAGQFRKGQRQFEMYQTYDNNDVENVVWRYLCQARVDGVDKARVAMLKVRHDRRVPMMKIYDLYRGKATVKDVEPLDFIAKLARVPPVVFHVLEFLRLCGPVPGVVDHLEAIVQQPIEQLCVLLAIRFG